MTLRTLLLALAVCFAGTVSAQKFKEHPEDEVRNKGKAILAHLLFATHLSAGDLADRFGQDGSFGLGGEWLTKSNFQLGVEGSYFFGAKVKEDPLAILRDPEGAIIGNDQRTATVALKERGYYIGASAGKLFPFGQKRSGLRITLGAGVMRHWMHLQDDTQSVGAITGDYAKGYDRLTGGPALHQFIGWQHLGADRRANWQIGLDFTQGFTHTLRDWDFTAMRKLDGQRLDLRFGLRAVWTIPFYVGGADEIFY